MAQSHTPKTLAQRVKPGQLLAFGIRDSEFGQLHRSCGLAAPIQIQICQAIGNRQNFDDPAVLIRHPAGSVIIVVTSRHDLADGKVQKVF